MKNIYGVCSIHELATQAKPPQVRRPVFVRLAISSMLVLSSMLVQAQTQSILTLNTATAIDASASSKTITATDKVYLKPGFKATNASATSVLTVNVQNTNIKDPTVVPTEDYNASGGMDKGVHVPGAIAGTIDVSPTGAGTYYVPIELPAGAGGVTPSFGIGYSSGGGEAMDGGLGWGWNLAGVSVIKEEPDISFYDKTTTSSKVSKYMLDGQRLVRVTGKDYGAATYILQRNPYIRVVYSSQEFKVYGSDGSVSSYAYHSQQYMITEVKYPDGQTISYQYADKTTATGNTTTLLSKISYPGNMSVMFQYDALGADNQLTHTRDMSGYRTNVLRSIYIFADSRLASQYDFQYFDADKPRLFKISKSVNGVCVNSTNIKWGSEVAIDASNAETKSNFGQLYEGQQLQDQLITGDFDGNGTTDAIVWKHAKEQFDIPNTVKTIMNDMGATGSVTELPKNSVDAYNNTTYVGVTSVDVVDWDNDGDDDMLVDYFTYSNNSIISNFVNFYSYKSSGWTLVNKTEWSYANSYYGCDGVLRHYYTDLDGDGKLNRLTLNSTKGKLIENSEYDNTEILQSPLWHYQQTSSNDTYNKDIKDIKFVNVNYDSYPDLLVLFNDGSNRKEWIVFENNNKGVAPFKYYPNQGDHAVPSDGGWPSGPEMVYPADFDGNGMTDYLIYNNGWKMSMNGFTGIRTGFITNDNSKIFADLKPIFPFKHIGNVVVTDLDGDGKSDVVVANKGIVAAFISVGRGNVKLKLKGSTASLGTSSDYELLSVNEFYTANTISTSEVRKLVYGSSGSNYKLIPFSGLLGSNLKVSTITDGNGTVSTFNYAYSNLVTETQPTTALINDPNLSSPARLIKNPIMLVKSTSQTNSGSAVKVDKSYEFSNPYYYPYGVGFLGFKKMKSIYTGVGSTETNFSLTASDGSNTFIYPWPVSTKNSNSTSAMATNTLELRKISNDSRSFFPLTVKQVVTDVDKVTTTNEVLTFDDANGTTTKSKVTKSGTGSNTWTTETTNTYASFTVDEYTFPRLSSQEVKTTNGTETPYSVTTTNTYGSYKLRPDKVVSSGLTSTLAYDSWGNVTSKQVTDGSQTRISSATYDATGRFMTSSTDEADRTTTYSYDPTTGNLLSTTDPYGNTTSYGYYNSSSSMSTTVYAPGTTPRVTTRTWASGSSETVKETTTQEGFPTTESFYDALGNLLRQTTQGLNGTTLASSCTYNSDGTLATKTTPTSTTEYTYDTRKRVITEKNNQDKNLTYSYSGLSSTVKNVAKGTQTKTTNYDVMGNVTKTSGTNGEITYSYYSHGKLKSTTAPNGGTTIITYDPVTLKQTQINDPSSGKTTYTINSFDELSNQTDANGKTQECWYTDHHNITMRQTSDFTETYEYDPQRIGLLTKVTRGNYSEQYTYDNLARPLSITYNMNGKTYTSSVTYDSYGRLATRGYPSGLSVKYSYDAVGNIKKIEKTDGTVVWEGKMSNNLGQWTEYWQGNTVKNSRSYDSQGYLTSITAGASASPSSLLNIGYKFNNIGQLEKRWVLAGGPSETFTYDDQDRLTKAEVLSSGVTTSFSTSYNGINISTTSQAGTYNYVAGKPYQVSGTTSNQSGDPILDKCSYTYSSDNKILSISQYQNNMKFVYGPGGSRVSMSADYGRYGKGSTKLYVGDCEIGLDNADKQLWMRTFVQAPTGITAVWEQVGATATMYNIHTDFQGSWMAVSNPNGTIATNPDGSPCRYNYDAWGRPRNPSTWLPYTPSSTNQNALAFTQPRFDRGYTGHEHLNQFGLINMNGRLYDPNIQAFLSPDPYIQSPGNPLNYNRYSYCINNPLRYTDPNGYFFGLDDAVVIGVGFAFGYVSYGITQGDWGWDAVKTGLICGAIAEIGYLTLGGGLALASIGTPLMGACAGVGVCGVAGSMGAAIGYSLAFATYGAIKVYNNYDRLKNSNKNMATLLIAGYATSAAIDAGFYSEGTSGSIDALLGIGSNRLIRGAVSYGIGGAISTGIDETLNSYNPNTNTWNIDGVDIAKKSITAGFFSSASKIAGNTFDLKRWGGKCSKNDPLSYVINRTFKASFKYGISFSKNALENFDSDSHWQSSFEETNFYEPGSEFVEDLFNAFCVNK